MLLVTACGRVGYDAVDATVADGPDGPVYASCVEVRDAQAGAADGVYLVAAGPDGAPVPVYCDLTQDGGGWMLVTRDMVASEQSLSVTVVAADDARGGLVMRVYANAEGCTQPLDNVHLMALSDRPAWTEIRARYRFAGANSCWWILGAVSPDESAKIDGNSIVSNIIPFEFGVDTIREQVRMGGAAGDAFDGMSTRCDNDAANFWHDSNGFEERSAVVILRRSAVPGAAGLATTTSCTEFGPGTTSPTWWEYSEIAVR